MWGYVLRVVIRTPRYALRPMRRLRNFCLRVRLKMMLGRCGRRLQAQRPFVILAPRSVEMGDDVSFAAFLHVWGAGGVQIGNRVMIGPHVAISSLTHSYQVAVMRNSVIAKPVVIEDEVWIGAHSTILPGVRIGRGAVVGAGAVVTRDVPARAIVAGVPARVMKFRPERRGVCRDEAAGETSAVVMQ